MSQSLEYLLKHDYFPYFSKDDLLEKVKTFINPEEAREFVLTHYDKFPLSKDVRGDRPLAEVCAEMFRKQNDELAIMLINLYENQVKPN